MKAVKARKDAVAGASRRAVERSLKTLEGCTVYEGHARFTAEKSVVVGDIELSADRIFINVGGRAWPGQSSQATYDFAVRFRLVPSDVLQ